VKRQPNITPRVSKFRRTVTINNKTTPIKSGVGVVVPAGSRHNVKNTGKGPLQLYTLYAPPHHEDGTVDKTKANAISDTEHFTGETSE